MALSIAYAQAPLQSRRPSPRAAQFFERLSETLLPPRKHPDPYKTYAGAFFRVTTPRFLPAAGGYVPIFCVRFFPLRAEKPHTIGKERTALPKAQHANCVSPTLFCRWRAAGPP